MSKQRICVLGIVCVLLLVYMPVTTTTPNGDFELIDTEVSGSRAQDDGDEIFLGPVKDTSNDEKNDMSNTFDNSRVQNIYKSGRIPPVEKHKPIIYNKINDNNEDLSNNEEEPEPLTDPECGEANKFETHEELVKYIYDNTEEPEPPDYYGGAILFSQGIGTTSGSPTSTSSGSSDYSSTNNQVEGVDEPDIVKTDGEYIYALTEKNVAIVKAYPPGDAEVISIIEYNNRPEEMFINGDWLVTFEKSYKMKQTRAIIKIIDISSRSNPVLSQNISVTGKYLDSRMIDNYVYVIAGYYSYIKDNNISLPIIEKDNMSHEVEPTEIESFNGSAQSFGFTIVLSINLEDSNDFKWKVYLTEVSDKMYVSPKNIYLTNSGWFSYETNIHKISIDDGNITYVCSGEVPGKLLDQFAMDEYEGFLRVATWQRYFSLHFSSAQTNVYVLDELLNLVGKIEGIAPEEYMHSSRFMGNRVYLVTFEKVDPFFVIDLSKPSEPKILGELKIPGYSDYLHPYDENHIIGLGKETVEADGGDFSWYQGVKLSLFNVTDFDNPTEMAKYIIGDRGTSSPALSNHKAFLFSKSKNMLIIPIRLALIDHSKYPEGAPSYATGDYVFQGAYIFRITLENGFELRGRITHFEDDATSSYFSCPHYYYSANYPHGYCIIRTLYIEDYIYTISDEMIKINNMDTLWEIRKIELVGPTVILE